MYINANISGFCSAEALSIDKIRYWLGKGYQASMKWMERVPEARGDPKSLLPEAQTVICVGFAYGNHGLLEDNNKKNNYNPLRARFARGEEYHKFVRQKLKLICEELKKDHPQAKFKICVDTSPIFEKALAARAGLGWIGKNTLLINPKFGSYLVLGEIITDIDFGHCEEQKRRSNPDHLTGLLRYARNDNIGQCGDCRKCLKACPTGALVEPYVLDARRCLSYLTIEHKTEIPEEFKKFIKPGQYGCDICQQVCPYNV
ncbi:MAG: QueG-associated DUF1730 domain-containing protein [Pseudomonadota bacterium]